MKILSAKNKFLILVCVLAMSLIPVCFPLTAMAATSADVSVTATGAYVSYTSNASSYNFGTVATSTTTNSSGVYIAFTNTSTVSTNISVRMLAATWTSSGAGWTHNDAAAGANTAAMKANSSNSSTWSSSVFVKFNTAYNEIASAVAHHSTVLTGLSLLAPTSFTDGGTNNNTVMFSFYQE